MSFVPISACIWKVQTRDGDGIVIVETIVSVLSVGKEALKLENKHWRVIFIRQEWLFLHGIPENVEKENQI